MGERKRMKKKRKGEKRNKPRCTGHFAVLLVRGLVCELVVGGKVSEKWRAGAYLVKRRVRSEKVKRQSVGGKER